MARLRQKLEGQKKKKKMGGRATTVRPNKIPGIYYLTATPHVLHRIVGIPYAIRTIVGIVRCTPMYTMCFLFYAS